MRPACTKIVYQNKCNNVVICRMYLVLILELLMFQWLQTLPTSKKSFTYVRGECPNCSMVSYYKLEFSGFMC
jgi:hypothetical protein